MFPEAAAALVTRAAFRSQIGGDVVTKARAMTGAVPAEATPTPARSAFRVIAVVIAVTLLGGCSREKIDWKSAEAADTLEGYDHFIERHPDSDLATQARARIAQLNEDRNWKRATVTDTADGYRQFLAQHENGKWAEEARIRIENFALDGTAAGPRRPSDSPLDPARAASPTADAARAVRATAADEPILPAPKPGLARPSTPTAQSKATPVAGAAAPVPTPVTPPLRGQFGIQLGAFRSQEAALNEWKRIQVKFDSDLHGLSARAVPVQQSAGTLFRLQAAVGAEARARAICATLASRSQPCVVVLPPPH